MTKRLSMSISYSTTHMVSQTTRRSMKDDQTTTQYTFDTTEVTLHENQFSGEWANRQTKNKKKERIHSIVLSILLQ
jgi:hypothetical protein